MARKALGKRNASGSKPRKTAAQPRKAARKPRTPVAAKSGDLIAALADANAQALRIALDPAWRGGVIFNLGLILRLAALVDEFPLPDDTEPGPIFHA
jgi:hypothetical protein